MTTPAPTTYRPTSLFLPLLPLSGPITRHLPERLTHASSRRSSLEHFEHQLEADIASHTHLGKELSEFEVEGLKRELCEFEGMTVSQKEQWVEFKESRGVELRKRSVAGAGYGGLVLV